MALQLNLIMNEKGEGDTSTFVLNGEWHLLGKKNYEMANNESVYILAPYIIIVKIINVIL